jgi:hypothetical protein
LIAVARLDFARRQDAGRQSLALVHVEHSVFAQHRNDARFGRFTVNIRLVDLLLFDKVDLEAVFALADMAAEL